jgi:threonine dehydrogenase-like Zn-dependent dehydrogenase
VIRITRSAICGTDLHFVRGTMAPMAESTVLGHEAVGVVEAVGDDVRGFTPGDRVVVCSTIGCGRCSYCRAGYYAQCDVANPNGPDAGTSFFGGPQSTGPVNGLQAEYARIPYAAATLVPIPERVTDDQAILISDIFPTGWFGARLAEVGPGDTVVVFGAGPVGQFAVASAKRQGAGRVLVVDGIETQLAMALEQNAEVINFNTEDPVEVIKHLTGGPGADRVIDAVGIDAQRPSSVPAAGQLADQAGQFDAEQRQVAPDAAPRGDQWVPGDAPSLAARWAVESVAKAGSIGIIGVYSPEFDAYPIGPARCGQGRSLAADEHARRVGHRAVHPDGRRPRARVHRCPGARDQAARARGQTRRPGLWPRRTQGARAARFRRGRPAHHVARPGGQRISAQARH